VHLTRRHVLALSLGASSLPLWQPARADDGAIESHGMSAFDDLKYPPDFHHFEYVNVDAPKGGMISLLPAVRTNNQSY